jgi:hypothetical protein
MGRPLRLLNLALGVVAVLIAAALAKAWSPRDVRLEPRRQRSSQELAVISLIGPRAASGAVRGLIGKESVQAASPRLRRR